MKYERAAKREATADWNTVGANKFTKRQASKTSRRHADELMRDEDADTSVPLWDDPDFLAFQEAA